MEEQAKTQNVKFIYKPFAPKGNHMLGPLEDEIMQVMWEQVGDVLTVAQVHRAIHSRRDIAYTTVMTTMSRMAKKRLLTQDRSGRQYTYRPAFLTRSDFISYVRKVLFDAMKEDGLLGANLSFVVDNDSTLLGHIEHPDHLTKAV